MVNKAGTEYLASSEETRPKRGGFQIEGEGGLRVVHLFDIAQDDREPILVGQPVELRQQRRSGDPVSDFLPKAFVRRFLRFRQLDGRATFPKGHQMLVP